MPSYLLAMGCFEKKWHVIFSYVVPIGCIWLILILGIPETIRGVKENWKKLK